ncbi:hypothetical protein HAX54_053324, partial [Datura stramonium]|nr:hypothetical protein [Datura stramonium]
MAGARGFGGLRPRFFGDGERQTEIWLAIVWFRRRTKWRRGVWGCDGKEGFWSEKRKVKGRLGDFRLVGAGGRRVRREENEKEEDGRVRVRLVLGFSGIVVFGWRGKEVGGEGEWLAGEDEGEKKKERVRRVCLRKRENGGN